MYFHMGDGLFSSGEAAGKREKRYLSKRLESTLGMDLDGDPCSHFRTQ